MPNLWENQMTIEEKAERLLVTKAVTIERVLVATVRGDHDTYTVFREKDRWRCTCPSRVRCSHIEAVERVTA